MSRRRIGAVSTLLFLGTWVFASSISAEKKSSEILKNPAKNYQKKALPMDPQKIPQIDVDKKQVTRSPAFSPMELELERLQDGRLRVKSVDPEGPFGGVVSQDQIFNNFEEIPQPKSDHSN